jgi:hypothetical protein
MTHDQIQEAIGARSLPQAALAALQRIGLTPDFIYSTLGQDPKNLPPGGFLTPQQRQQMLALGADVLNAQQAKARERAKIIGIDFDSFVSAPDVETPKAAPRTGGAAGGAGPVFDLSDYKKRFPQRDWREAVKWARRKNLSLVNASKQEQDFYNAQK